MNRKKVQHIVLEGLKVKDKASDLFKTAETINLKSLYSEKDIADLEHLDFPAGNAPFLRGPYSTMYVQRPWTCLLYTSDAADE